MASIPDYPDKIHKKEVEVSKEAWPLVNAVVRSVTIVLKSGASPMASRLFPTDNPVAAAIDQLVSLLRNRVVEWFWNLFIT